MTQPVQPVPAPQLSAITRAVRAGIDTDRGHGAVIPPIHLSSTFSLEELGKPRQFGYTRTGNPTRSQLADALASLEGGASAVITSTGISAATLVLQLVQPGEKVFAPLDSYGGTHRLLRAQSQRGLFDVVFADFTVAETLARIVAERPRLVWVETPSNPLLRITDVRAVARAAREAGALLVVDNTFLSPALQQPILLGADLVVHSTTKYLNGHSDLVGGAVIAKDAALGEQLAWWANCLGVTGSPFDSWLTLRGVRTLHARIREHLAGAAAVVDAACGHPAVLKVYYPGLADHPGHSVARSQQGGFGAMVSLELAGGIESVRAFVESLRCFTLAESLGGVESLVAHPATMTHASMDAAARSAAGISDSLVRLSVGIESPADLAADVRAALDAVLALSAERAAGTQAAVRVTGSRDAADVIVLGAGAIGRELVSQVVRASEQDGAPLRISGLVDRSGYVFGRGGLDRARLEELCARKAGGQPLAQTPAGQAASALDAVSAMARDGLTHAILVDATPADTTEVLHAALERGAHLVLANKVPLSADQPVVDSLHGAAARARRSILNEATVGAGLPVLDTLRKLAETGDTVLGIEGCPSGTLGFLFGELGRGEKFSDALRRAMELGYTEPDPRVDLSGVDVARKALILARAIGYRGNLSSVRVESLVPGELAGLEVSAFVERAAELDEAWAWRVNETRRRGRVLRYRAQVTPQSISVGLVPVRVTDPLGALIGTDNQFTFTTARYRERPLVISGPGAGPAVTAAGVLNDLLRLSYTHPQS